MSARNFVHKIINKRDSHRQRFMGLRVMYAFFGIIFIAAGTPLLILFPEAGIPLVLFGLGLLALEYVWAGRALLWFAKGTDSIVHWYRHLQRTTRYAIETFFLLLAIYITWLIFR